MFKFICSFWVTNTQVARWARFKDTRYQSSLRCQIGLRCSKELKHTTVLLLKTDWGGFQIYRWCPISFQWQTQNLAVASLSNPRAGRSKRTKNYLLLFRQNLILEAKSFNFINILNYKTINVLQKITNMVHSYSPICAII